MRTSAENIREIIDFKGLWDQPSKCGLLRIEKGDKRIIIVSELYQDNPGSSITSVSASLAMQIAERYHIGYDNLIYIETSPEMHSKLSFYDEEYFLVSFDNQNDILSNPQWKKLKKDEFLAIVK